jgi:membrane protease subunit HflK
VTVPDQVIARFNEVLKAGADRDRSKNEGQAYASDVIPRAQGDAAHLREDAIAYKARITDAAEAMPTASAPCFAEYQKARPSRATACTSTRCRRSTPTSRR